MLLPIEKRNELKNILLIEYGVALGDEETESIGIAILELVGLCIDIQGDKVGPQVSS